MTFDEFWNSLESVVRSEQTTLPLYVVEWVLSDAKDRMRRVCETSGTEVFCVAAFEMLRLSAELYGAKFGVPVAAIQQPKMRPGWLQFVIDNANLDAK